MSRASRRGRPAPLRWSGSIALAGIALATVGGYLVFDDRAGAAPDVPAVTAPGPPPVSAPPAAASRPLKPTASPPALKLPAEPGRPRRISVPHLQISAPVIPISAEDGALTPPADPQVLGWWSGGAQPGAQRGSAVITGHTVHTGGGALDNLAKLRPDDAIGITTSRGQLSYRVATVTIYRKQTLAKNAPAVFDQKVPGRLVLITCDDWNGKTYLSNAVVVAQRTA